MQTYRSTISTVSTRAKPDCSFELGDMHFAGRDRVRHRAVPRDALIGRATGVDEEAVILLVLLEIELEAFRVIGLRPMEVGERPLEAQRPQIGNDPGLERFLHRSPDARHGFPRITFVWSEA
jgi:hypothetical protein